jgi:hypothetical protein
VFRDRFESNPIVLPVTAVTGRLSSLPNQA